MKRPGHSSMAAARRYMHAVDGRDREIAQALSTLAGHGDAARPPKRIMGGRGKRSMARKVREMIKLIEADGWTLARTRGSHRQFVHPTKPGVVTIAGRLGADLPVGTERSILKQAGL